MTKPLTRAEASALGDAIGKLLDSIEQGQLVASTSMRHRLEGARIALEAVGGRSSTLAELMNRFAETDSGRLSDLDSEARRSAWCPRPCFRHWEAAGPAGCSVPEKALEECVYVASGA